MIILLLAKWIYWSFSFPIVINGYVIIPLLFFDDDVFEVKLIIFFDIELSKDNEDSDAYLLWKDDFEWKTTFPSFERINRSLIIKSNDDCGTFDWWLLLLVAFDNVVLFSPKFLFILLNKTTYSTWQMFRFDDKVDMKSS